MRRPRLLDPARPVPDLPGEFLAVDERVALGASSRTRSSRRSRFSMTSCSSLRYSILARGQAALLDGEQRVHGLALELDHALRGRACSRTRLVHVASAREDHVLQRVGLHDAPWARRSSRRRSTCRPRAVRLASSIRRALLLGGVALARLVLELGRRTRRTTQPRRPRFAAVIPDVVVVFDLAACQPRLEASSLILRRRLFSSLSQALSFFCGSAASSRTTASRRT
jgi:hypothetical protein